MSTSSSAAGFCRRNAVSATLGMLLVGIAATPAYADSVRSMQWHLDAMKADQMWMTSKGRGVTVAVIDGGVDSSNPDLIGQVLKGKDLAPDASGDEHTDYDGHGTSMAGLIAGTGQRGGGNGAFGLAPGVKILPIRMPKSGVGSSQAAEDEDFNKDAPIAIRYAVDHGAKVINISLGAQAGSQQLTGAVKYALDKGSLIFAAAGNSGDEGNLVEYPAGTPGVVGVGAIGRDLKKTDESQSGPQVDLTAPGIDMVHTCTGGTQLCKTSGTSDATAIASASAALIWSKHPDWTNNQVLRVMLNTAGGPTSGAERNDYVGYGVVRPRIALTTPGDPGPADEYPLPDLAAAESAQPSAKPSKATGSSESDDKPATAAPASGTDSNTGLWIGLGIGVAALIGAAVTALAIRSRRRRAAATTPPAYTHQPPYPYPSQHQPAPSAFEPPPTAPPGSNSPYGGPPRQGPYA
ncbi:type VII secretion-associated serine protease mycosin [Streptomyces sp. NBC_01800]|uniref:type VII secretion-associated serine protease mycosin n=1 Tax=Streptomyces sp. NBC_01800 TaxID=2975945 RepID=UPI002DDA9B5B|nr:type VII secretion-associated serine protease mycosin [Streptomyces sp. NBC_01800]WSA68476.1 type VII secretion-associated serine protease mycosin [Streptomyces sp. NBC_01800]